MENKLNAQNYPDFTNHLIADLSFQLDEIQQLEIVYLKVLHLPKAL